MWAHSLVHKKVQNEQLKQWIQWMQCELFLGNLVLVDLKRVSPRRVDTVGVWGSNPHAPTNVFNNLAHREGSRRSRTLQSKPGKLLIDPFKTTLRLHRFNVP